MGSSGGNSNFRPTIRTTSQVQLISSKPCRCLNAFLRDKLPVYSSFIIIFILYFVSKLSVTAFKIYNDWKLSSREQNWNFGIVTNYSTHNIYFYLYQYCWH